MYHLFFLDFIGTVYKVNLGTLLLVIHFKTPDAENFKNLYRDELPVALYPLNRRKK